MTFARLTAGDWIAWLCALALIGSTAVDWYSSRAGEEARRIERLSDPEGGTGGEVEREVEEDARLLAEREERNALRPAAAIDVAILVLLLGTAALAFAAGVARAAGRRFQPPRTPSAAAAVAGAVLAALIAYRIVQEPGLDAATTVKAGALLALIAAAGVSLGAGRALAAEQAGTAWREPGAPGPERAAPAVADDAPPSADPGAPPAGDEAAPAPAMRNGRGRGGES